MCRAVVGTAGHVDHGKTSLVKALTGIDCDRLKEEKERGVTVDIGFAYLHSDEVQLGFVDVPGHEKFIHNTLVGMGGINIMLLVVAADDGVMPQTAEHLDFCTLEGITSGVVAITKSDLVSDDWVAELSEKVHALLCKTPFASSRIIRVSVRNGVGIADVKDELKAIAKKLEPKPAGSNPVRLPIDRSFCLNGLGTTVTGTLLSGTITPGLRLTLLPSGSTVRVRTVHVHNEPRGIAVAGERTSLQLAGIQLSSVTRGMQLTTPDIFECHRSILALATLLSPTCSLEARTAIP